MWCDNHTPPLSIPVQKCKRNSAHINTSPFKAKWSQVVSAATTRKTPPGIFLKTSLNCSYSIVLKHLLFFSDLQKCWLLEKALCPVVVEMKSEGKWDRVVGSKNRKERSIFVIIYKSVQQIWLTLELSWTIWKSLLNYTAAYLSLEGYIEATIFLIIEAKEVIIILHSGLRLPRTLHLVLCKQSGCGSSKG